MNKRLIAILVALSPSLTGCASLLDQEYVHVTPHNAAPTAEGDPSTLRAESYQELVNALLYFVTSRAETGCVRLYLDAEDVEAELEAACLEVVQEDPLGAYCVDYIKYSVAPLVTYSEADVQITYRRTPEQVASISSVTGITAIRNELEAALSSFAVEQVLRISYFDGDESFIKELFRQAYYANPLAALDLPDITVSIYPDTGRQRIVEIGLTYHLNQPELELRRDQLASAVQQLSLSLPAEDGEAAILAAAHALQAAGGYDPEGGSTAYHALLEGSANSEGLALAFAALCQTLEIPCQVVEGTKQELPHFWNLVTLEDSWYHMDLTALSEEAPLLTAPDMTSSGYLWSADSYPASTVPSLPEN